MTRVLTANPPVIDAFKVFVPVLRARGEYDGIATEVDLLNFYKRLPVADRQLSILPGAAHALALGINRQQFWHVVRAISGDAAASG